MFFAVYYSKKLQLYNRPRGMPPKRPPWQKHHIPNPRNIEIPTAKWACKTTYLPHRPGFPPNRPHCQSERCPDCFRSRLATASCWVLPLLNFVRKKMFSTQSNYSVPILQTWINYTFYGTGEEIRNSVDYRGKDRPPDGEQQHVSQRRECRKMFTTSSPTTNHVRM